MVDFQNRLISGIFGVFSSGFLHRATLMWLKNRISRIFWNFNFWPKLTILQRPFNDGRFSKTSHFSNIWCFLERFFAERKFDMIKLSLFASFLNFNFCPKLTTLQKRYIAFAWWPIFKIVSFLQYWCFVKQFFPHNNSNMIKESFFHVFFYYFNFWPNLTTLQRQ